MNKKLTILAAVAVIIGLLLLGGRSTLAGPPSAGCITIRDGVLTYSPGHYLASEPLSLGYDPYGYNYQAHIFNGFYANAYLGRDGLPPYEGDTEAYLTDNPGATTKWYWSDRDVHLQMKWSDIWLSNKDCNGDGKLDRGGPADTGSAADGAWLTNHQRGEYEGEESQACKWTYFVKIVYPPGGPVDTNHDGYDDNTGGEIIWGSFVVIEEVSNDPCAGEHGNISSVQPTGFGAYK